MPRITSLRYIKMQVQSDLGVNTFAWFNEAICEGNRSFRFLVTCGYLPIVEAFMDLFPPEKAYFLFQIAEGRERRRMAEFFRMGPQILKGEPVLIWCSNSRTYDNVFDEIDPGNRWMRLSLAPTEGTA